MKKIIVLAGNYSEFVRHMHAVGAAERDRLIYADTPIKIAGCEAERVDEVGTFYERKDAFEMRQLANSRIKDCSHSVDVNGYCNQGCC
jgi:hypothetical protein